MQKTIRQLLCLFITLCLLLCGCTPRGAFDEAVFAEKALAQETDSARGKLLQNTDWFPAGSSAADWLALTLRLCGVKEDYTAFLDDLYIYVSQSGSAKMLTTAYARFALTICALGGDPTAFGTDAADLLHEGYLRWQSEESTLNSTAYLLIAMDACGYADGDMRETLLEAIVSGQETDGGFGLTPGSSDTDVTAMALQAIAPYKETYTDTVEKALACLAQTVTENGTCVSMGSANAESTAQVILALCALEIDPREDARFAELADGLLRFRLENGLYRHTEGAAQFDVLATQQSLLARLALYRLHNGENWIYAF